ncbi:hypothetical protein [Parafrankia discariae]|uniref:hypothetical protein n=1 Tax=Parafrankia discariae TaxID=365528 RepID=UPI000360BCCB|nr:hypothetical protein [Parafrankia discariae]
MTTRRASLWRHPALTPGYAAAIAVGAVALSSVVVASAAASQSPVTGKPEQVDVTLVGAPGTSLPAGLTVQIRHGTTVLADGGIDAEGRWSENVVPGDHEVCVVSSTTPIRVAGSDPASTCTRERVSGDTPTKVTVERVRVVAERADGDDPPPSGGTVTIRHGRSEPRSDALDSNGRFMPSELPLNAVVCLDPPAGWRFADTETRDQQCQAVTNPAADVLFRLEES